MKTAQRTFQVRVAEKTTGDERTLGIQAGSQMEAEAKCGNDEWLVIPTGSPIVDAPSPPRVKKRDSVTSGAGDFLKEARGIKKASISFLGGIWHTEDPTERAIVRGIVKAYGFILVVTFWVVLGIAMIIFLFWLFISLANA